MKIDKTMWPRDPAEEKVIINCIPNSAMVFNLSHWQFAQESAGLSDEEAIICNKLFTLKTKLQFFNWIHALLYLFQLFTEILKFPSQSHCFVSPHVLQSKNSHSNKGK